MKKLLTYLAAAVVLTVPNAKTASSSSIFDESGAFVIARSVKLGDANISSFSPKTSEDAQKTCDPSDPTCSGGKHCDSAAECADGEYCTTVHVCKPLCEKNITLDKVKCSGETPVCTASNHKSYCACTDDSCPNAYKCAESGKSASCSACSKDEECGCPAGTVSNGGGQCVTCNFDTKCADDQYCANAGTASSACQTVSCGADEYAANHTCNSCSGAISNCAECNNAKACLVCQKGYDLVDGKCVLHDCGQGQYLNMDDGQCYSCINGCKSCSNGSTCDECEAAYDLQEGLCTIKTCGEGLYLNSETGECLSCPSTCTACSTVMTSSETSICTACAEGYALDAATGECRQLNCSDAEYVKGNECLPCSGSISNCLSCSGENTCTKCANGYTLENGQCVGIDCAAGSYLNTSKDPASCDSCSSPCATCSGSATSCTSCIDGYKLSRSDKFSRVTCVQKSCSEMGYSTSCPSGYTSTYVTSGSDGSCYTCSKPSGYCASDSDCGDNTKKCVNNSCTKKSCAEINSSYKTSCAAGENKNATGATGSDGTCYTCSAIAGWCSSDSQCGTNEKCVNNSCAKKSCSEINSTYKTSCSAGENKNSTGVSGSDGTCYTCSAISGWCSSDSDCGSTEKCVNNGCTLKSCGELGFMTSCGIGYTSSSEGVKGSDGQCVSCSVAPCPNGYSTSTTSCGSGYSFSTSGYSAGLACGACSVTACPSGYSTSVTSCNSCNTFSTNGYSAGKACGKCTPKACASVSCSSADGYTTSSDSCGCTTCVAASCPSGYSTSTTSCSSGYSLETNGKSGGKTCGKCVAASCPDGYSTTVTRCDSGYKLETNGTAGGKTCGKCVMKTCAEMGYSTSCGQGYTKSSYASNGSIFFHSWAGADGTCYDCVKRECPAGYSTSTTSCTGSKVLDIDGYSGSEKCGACLTNCGPYHKANSKGYCECTTYAKYDYGCGGGVVMEKCKSESVPSDFGKACTSGSQCSSGLCASCGLTGATKQGSTCR